MKQIDFRRRMGGVIACTAITSALVASSTTSGVGAAVKHVRQRSTLSGNITWWGKKPTPDQAEIDFIKPFNRRYPHIHIKYRQIYLTDVNQALEPALASNVGPDLYEMSPGGGNESIAVLGRYAANLAPAVKKALGPQWQSKLASDGIRGMTTTSGKFAAMSVGSTYAGNLWVNQGLFAEYHLAYPTNLTTWVHVCSVFQAHGVGCFVQGAGEAAFNQDLLQSIADSVKPGVWTAASRGLVKWTNPVIVKALSIWKKLFSDGIMETGALGLQQYPDANNAFLQQKYAMVMMGSWYMINAVPGELKGQMSAAGVSNPKPFTIVPIAFPDVAGNGHPASLYGDSDFGIAVNAKSHNRAAAEAFAIWMGTSRYAQQAEANTLQEIPALKNVTPQWSNVKFVDPKVQRPALTKLVAEASASNEPRLSLISANLQQAIGIASQSVANGQATPGQAAATLEQAARSGTAE